MRDLLRNYFGHDNFLPMQEEIISTVLDGEDALVVMPTGGGKSLCYQLPALRFSGLTLVVSPLMALMQDQVESLRSKGVSAAFVNSSLSHAESQSVQTRALEDDLNILYVTPERLVKTSFRRFLNRLEISLVAVDEAHCISIWGHDFRKEYRRLGTLRRELPGVPFLALTATATEHVRSDIINELQLTNPRRFIDSFNRPNLKYRVLPKRDERNDFARLKEILQRFRGEAAIIYRSTQRSVERLAWRLSQDGFEALPYHGGLDWIKRSTTQRSFLSGSVPVIVATNAFGMGIDKPDIRMIVHYDFPMSLEGYYQETGRAGRDGSVADCVLFYSRSDRKTPDYLISQMKDASQRRNASRKLEQVLEFCELRECRRNYLLHYFDEPWNEENCGSCDNCLRKLRQSPRMQVPTVLTGLSGDFEILMEIKSVLAADGSLNWSGSVAVEEWEGITTNGSIHPPRVTAIRLEYRGLTGPIPAEFGRLAKLEVLSLEENMLEGPIPAELGKLANLKSLSLEENELSGSIPPELGSLGKLNGLNLYDNNLVGTIPPELGNLGELDALFLEKNNLRGPIPPELGNLTNLSVLSLGNNKLKGQIPSELGNVTNLEALFLEDNKLSGLIPSELGYLANLEALYLNDNKLSGRIPSELGKLTRLNTLYLNDNKLSGRIPAELGKLTKLNTLHLNDNKLSGRIPPELGSLTNLEAVSIGENDLSGTVPDTWRSIRENDFSDFTV